MKLNYGNGIKMVAFTLCMVMITSPVLSSASLSLEKAIGDDHIGQSITPIEKTVIEPKGIPVTPDDHGLTLTYQVNPDDIKFQEQTIDGISYQKISLQDYPLTTEAGKPQLPQITKLLAIPDQGDPQVEIISSDYTILPNVNVCPVPQPQILSSSKEQYSTENEFTIDNTVYSANQLYPEKLADLGPGSYLREQRLARLTINPLQWNPVTKELRVYTTITIKIVFSEKLVCKDAGLYTDLCSRLVTNYENPSLVSGSLKTDVIPPAGTVSYPEDLSSHEISADYLILTSNTFYLPAKQDFQNGTQDNCLNEFAFWRANYSGFDVAVVSVDNSFIGGNIDTAIKQFVQYAYENWQAPHMSDGHVGYVLLVGDTPFVATHMCGAGGVADRWFVCIGDEDYSTPDISIGRFPVNTFDELNVVTEKTITYERDYTYTGDEETRWHTSALLAFGSTGAEYWGQQVTEQLLESGWNTSTVTLINGEGNPEGVYNNMNDGKSIVVHCGHGMATGWEVTNGEFDMDQLHNGNKLPLVYSLSCLTGSFQNSYYCLGEKLLLTPQKGAIAFWGASSLTYYISFFNLFKSIFENHIYILGDIINEEILESHGAAPEYNLLGDPALDLSGSKGRLAQDKPDLTLTSSDITLDTSSPVLNEETIITATVHNIGSVSANNVQIRFLSMGQQYSDPQIIDTITIPGEIPADGEAIVECSWRPQTTGKTTVFVQVDPENTLMESCKWNNQGGTICTVFATAIYVDDDYTSSTPGWGITHFSKISTAINAAADQGVIQVFSGVYNEQTIGGVGGISKSIALIGQDATTTIIHWNGGFWTDPAMIRIFAQGASISGFTIEGGVEGIGICSDDVIISGNIFRDITTGIGIRLSCAERATITNNWFDSGGILLEKDPRVAAPNPTVDDWNSHVIEGNFVQGNPIYYLKNTDGTGVDIPADAAQIILANCTHFTIHDRIFSGNVGGIQLGFSSDNIITNNDFSSMKGDALVLEGTTNTQIMNNIFHDNIGNTIYLAFCSQNTISQNDIRSNNGNSIQLSTSISNQISGNTIQDSTGTGIALKKDSEYNTITNNIISSISSGVGLSNSLNNLISQNILENVNNGITLLDGSTSNLVSQNSILDTVNGIIIDRCSENTVSENIFTRCTGTGIILSDYSSSNNLTKNRISFCSTDGITLSNSNRNLINNNIVSDVTGNGLSLTGTTGSSENAIIQNIIFDSMDCGILIILQSDANRIIENTITHNFIGINITLSDDNRIYHNTFIDNNCQASDTGINFWDNGYPSGGNYWDDYTGVDQYRGSEQNIPGSDGIGDAPYIISIINGVHKDRYPLMQSPYILGDVNNDKSVSDADVDPFIAALGTTENGFRIQYPMWNWRAADCNHDGRITFADIDPFVEVLQSPPPPVNQPPLIPVLSLPFNHAINVSLTATVLSWIGGDPDLEDTVTFDVFLGTSNPPPMVATNQISTIYDPVTLSRNSCYYWQIIAWDNHGFFTMSPIWDFVTEAPNQPPYIPSNPTPSNGAMKVPTLTYLQWTGGDPDPQDSVTYDVWMEKSTDSELHLVGTVNEPCYHPEILQANTHYTWQIVAKDSHGAPRSGPVWSFTTGSS